MSFWMRFAVGTTKVPLELVLNDTSGGVSGESPTLQIRRVSDGFFLDFADNNFKASGHTTDTQSMTDRGDGRYTFNWDSSKSVKTPEAVVVEYDVSGSVKGIDNDIISFTNEENILTTLSQTPLANVGDGPGACQFVYTLTKSSTGAGIEDATVWVTTDSAGEQIIAGPKKTDADGKVIFYLDPGTYFFFRKKGGFTFSNPDVQSF